MKECIYREAAIAVIYGQHVGGKEACENARPNTYGADLREIVAGIEDIPAADVRENKKGRWLTGNDNPRTYGRIRAMCGRCGAFALAEMVNAGSYKERLSNFCPNCGADMREPPKEET